MPPLRFFLLLTLGTLVSTACSESEPATDQADARSQTVVDAPEAAADHAGAHEDHADDDEPRRDVGAHLHGDAKLAIALEDTVLYVELDTPLFNLIGFEHAPRSDEEIEIQRSAQARLAEPGSLFRFSPAAGCVPAPGGDAPVDLQAMFEDEHDDEHADEHADEHDDEHADDHADDDTGEHGGHRDTLIAYRFDCSAPDGLEQIDVRLFEHFPRLEELDVVYLDQNTQSTHALSRANTRITLER